MYAHRSRIHAPARTKHSTLPIAAARSAPGIGFEVKQIKKERTIRRRGKLTAGGKPVGHETLEKHGVEVGTREVDGCCVSCRSRADDHLHHHPSQLIIPNRPCRKQVTYDFRVHLVAFGDIGGRDACGCHLGGGEGRGGVLCGGDEGNCPKESGEA